MSQQPGVPELRDYLAVLKARKWTILITLFAVVGAALAYSLQQNPLYIASARLLVRPPITDISNPDQRVNLDTAAEVVMSEPVATLAVEDLGLDTAPVDLLDQVEALPVSEEGEVLLVRFASSDPQLAADGANAFAENYIEHVEGEALAIIEGARAAVEQRLDTVRRRLGEINLQIQEAERDNNDELVALYETERGALIARLGLLEQELDNVPSTEAVASGGGTVIEAAIPPGSPASPNHVTNVLRAVVIGLFLATGLAFVKERLDNRFRNRADVERWIRIPVLAVIPTFRREKRRERPRPILLTDPHDPASEAYRTLRTNLEFVLQQQGRKSLVITSPSAGDGKTITTANLAVAFAHSGKRVVLLSADLRRPRVDKYFDIRSDVGLVTWLEGSTSELRPFVQKSNVANVLLVASGPIPINPSELLASPRLDHLITAIEAEADIVLIDSPPALAVSDAAVVASRVGAALLVLDATRTPRSAAARAKQELAGVGAEIVGAVLNSLDVAAARYSYDYADVAYRPVPTRLPSQHAGSGPAAAVATEPTP